MASRTPGVVLPACRHRLRAPLLLRLTGGLTALTVNVPLAYILFRSVQAGWRPWVDTVGSRATLTLLAETLLLVAGVVALALTVALPLAWLVVRTDLRARRLWAVLGALPLVFPSYVSAFALVAVLGPRGYLQSWLEPLGVERLPSLAHGYIGALLALALFTYPYIYLLLVAALRTLDPAREESSTALGRGALATLRRVTLPQLRPAIYGGSLLVALYVVSDFGAVSIARYNTLTLSIYNAYRSLFDRGVAASLATVLVALALALIGVQALLQRRTRPTRSGVTRKARTVALGRWQWPCQAVLVLLASFTIGLPVGVVGYWGLRGLAAGSVLGSAGQAAVNSVGVSALAALAAALFSIPVAAWSVRYPGGLSRAAERLSYSGFALPGIVIALALVYLVTQHLLPLYQTLALLVTAYVVRFLPEALSATRASLADIAPLFEEAGASLGRGRAAVWRTVTLPLIRPGLLAGAGLVFLTSMKELPATLILRPLGFDTLATRVWNAASDAVYSEAALPALLLLLASALPIYWLVIRPVLAERG
jgi:iron(III) transport system permease protein